MAFPLADHGRERVEKTAGLLGVARLHRRGVVLAEFVGIAPGLNVRVVTLRVLFIPKIVLSVADE
ncbi:hypothetical protein ACFCX0_46580 [Streptomyces sp. NPDC056352]|uniref:hypothetical protein n=1 Tax=Streptomyces sp. NPDC056352 TaxID=3345791 RepID=UPI0035DE8667